MNAKWPYRLAALLALLVLCGCTTPSTKYVDCQRDVEYGRPNGKSLKLDVYSPKEATNRMPVIIWIHGGSWKAGSKDKCPVAFLAEKGVIAVSIQYRFIDDAKFPAQVHDCKGVVRWLRANAERLHIDPTRIGVLGASAGGHLAAMLGTTAGVKDMEGDVGGNLDQSSRVQAVCAFYPPTDLNLLIKVPRLRTSPDSDVGRWLGGPLEQNLEKAARANPANYITPDDSPFYILHGADDPVVPLQHSKLLHEALVKGGVESTLYIVPHKGHGIGAPPTAAKQIMDFFGKHLKLEDKTK